MPKWDLSRIKRLKLEKSLSDDRLVTYAEIADFVGVSASQIERYANGRVDNPNLEVMDKIGRFFGVDWMFFVASANENTEENKRRAKTPYEVAPSLVNAAP